MVPTPTSQDHIERQNTNKTPSTGKLNYETNKSVSLDRWVKMWPTPTAMTGGESVAPSHKKGQHGWNTAAAVHDSLNEESTQMWPTPRASGEESLNTKSARSNTGLPLSAAVEMWQTPVADDSVDRAKGKWNSRGEPKLSAQVKLWPTPTKQDANNNGGPSQHKRNSLPLNTAVLYPMQQVAADPKAGGKLNPQWVAWLMGYPTEYLNAVPWETRSSRRSRKK